MDFEINSQVPDDWAIKSISDVCVNVTSGGTPSRRKPEYYENGIYNWIKTKELDNGWIRNTEELITEDALKRSSAKLLPKNTVLLAMYGATVGELGILASEMTCNQACCAMIVDPEQADYRYLFYLLLSQKNNIKLLATGAAQQNLSATQIKSFKFPFPGIEVQKVIAKIIGDLDDKIELNRQTNQTLEHIAQAIFKSWFVDFEPTRAKIAARQAYHNLTPAEKAGVSEQHYIERAAICAISGAVQGCTNAADAGDCMDAGGRVASGTATESAGVAKTPEQLGAHGRANAAGAGSAGAADQLNPETQQQLKTTAALFPDALVESELGEVPEGWRTGSLKDCCLRVESGGTPKRSEDSYWNGSIRWLSSGEVRDVIILDTKEKISEEGLNNSSAKLWPPGSTVVAMYGATAGQVCLLANETTANQACCALIPKRNHQSYIFLVARRSIEDLAGKASGSAQQNLNKSLVADHKVLLPEDKVLEVFEQSTLRLLEMWIKNTEQNLMLAELRDSLLPKLLSGEVALGETQTTAEAAIG
jgi:type I restriction enzyme S subunit